MAVIRVTKQVVTWIDVDLRLDRNTKPKLSKRDEMKMLKLWHNFLQWALDTDTFPVVRGQSGPYGFSGGYKTSDAKKVIAWLTEHGVKVSCLVEDPKKCLPKRTPKKNR